MRVSAKAEYACIAILELAAHHANRTPVRVKTIVDAHGIPQRFLVQILLQLKGAGLVESVRGASGGYLLARPPSEISVADVVHTIDHPEPRRDPVAFAHSTAVQAIRAVWRDLQVEEQQFFDNLSIAELLRRAQETHELTYQI
jgi:Rrf2 family cysteine metabolism transcriptional repressor